MAARLGRRAHRSRELSRAGTTREACNREVNALVAKRLLVRGGPGHLHFLDIPALRELCGEPDD